MCPFASTDTDADTLIGDANSTSAQLVPNTTVPPAAIAVRTADSVQVVIVVRAPALAGAENGVTAITSVAVETAQITPNR
jgi:hypothetical protein